MSLYTKYRPQDFDNLVDQDFIKKTLKTAILENKTVWSYIFFWPRWTGKTSTARIFAKWVNCENPKDWNPCLECKICKSFAEWKLLDIIEIDAASNTWVDNIRDIIEKAQFSPNIAKYKVYIIDEVHMLSKWAFNALLKILEEPPEHLKFILATTEIHKVPETILSRCQRFDFKNISNVWIKKYLEIISEKEKIKTEGKAIDYIIKNSAGWLRTAISLFEQLIIDSEIKYENIIENLWIVGDEKMEKFLEKLLKKDNSIVSDFNILIDEGKNVKLFFKDLIFFTKDKLEASILEWKTDVSLIEILDNLQEYYLKSKNSIDENLVFFIGISKILVDYKNVEKVIIKEEKNIKKEKIVEKKIEKKQEIKKEENVEVEDAFDIFWDSPVEEKTVEIKKEKTNITENVWNFSIDTLINKIKIVPKKAFLSIWLKASTYKIEENIFYVIPQNKFTWAKINVAENIVLIQEKLKEMWFDYEVKVK